MTSMNEEDKQHESKPLESQLYKGKMPKLFRGDFLKRLKAAEEEIGKLPYGNQNPKAIEIARKYGLKDVPH